MADTSPQTLRLNKFLAAQLNIGRRQADTFIERGRVIVNGTPAILGAHIDPKQDAIFLDGKKLDSKESTTFTYLLMNKPVGYVCSRRQQGDTPTIYELVPLKYHHLKPVGRLDKDSSGLLLLTNDGDTAHHFMHPSFGKLKRYEVTLDKPLQPLHHQFINDHGIELQDGTSKLQLERSHEGNDREWIVHMHEGRNRQIRRTFEALGYRVAKLNRTQFGTLLLANMEGKLFKEIPKPQL